MEQLTYMAMGSLKLVYAWSFAALLTARAASWAMN